MQATNSSVEKELIERGKVLLESRDVIGATECFHQVVDANPQNSEAYFSLANIYHANGEIGKAIQALLKVRELDPNNTDAAISLSVIYNDIGRYDEARKIFNQENERVKNSKRQDIIEDQHINRKFSDKHFELEELYISYNRFDDALFEYNKCVALNPQNLDARIKMAKVYAKKGFKAKALEELRRLKNEHPSYIPARIAIGVFYYANGNILEAQSEWNKILAKDPTNKEAKMYLNLSRSATETAIANQ